MKSYPQKAGLPTATKLLNRGEMYWPAVTREFGRGRKISDEVYPTRSAAKAAARKILARRDQAILTHHIGTITIQGTQADIDKALARMAGRKA